MQMLSGYEIQVWDGQRSKGTKIHVGANGPLNRMLCGYWTSERVTAVPTDAATTCLHCAKKAETLLILKKAILV